MNFLQKLKSLTLVLLTLFCLSAISIQAQKDKRYGDAGFEGEMVDLKVVNADIRDILNYITEQYGVNFVIDRSVKNVPVTVNVTNVPWNIALDSVIEAQGLGIQVKGPILRVADAKTLSDEYDTLRKLQDGRLDGSPLYTEFIKLNYAVASGGGADTGFKVGVASSGGEESAGGGSGSGGGGIMPIIKKRISRRGSVEVDSRSNSLIITDVRENIDAIRQLVAILDQPQPQVEIEARIVVADRSFSRDIGVQLGGLLRGSNGNTAYAGTVPGSPSSGTGGAANTIGERAGGFPQGQLNPNNDLLSKIPNTIIGLTTGLFGSYQLSALISAGEKKGQAKTIATPRVTTLNNSKAEISSGQQIPVVTIQPGAGSGGALIATTTYIDVPLRLEVIPQITDAGTVVLNVVVENSSIPPTNGSIAPSINKQQMKSTMIVPDGGTTVVGGALLDSEGESQDRTPGLSKIPVLGNLFKRKGVTRNSSEILFFITPRIYRPDFDTEAKASEKARPATLLQPVPLGNPPSGSDPVVNQPLPAAAAQPPVKP